MAQSIEFGHERAHGGAILVELVRAMRPKQWVKNVFIFAAIAFSDHHLWTQLDAVLLVIATAVLFCMISGAIYLINDLVDIEQDRAHPKKCNRPLASGRLSPTIAIVAAVLLLLIGFSSAYVLDSLNGPDIDLLLILVTYALVQGLLYTYVLKHIVIVDIFTIAAGFMLRTIAGAAVLDIDITSWLLIVMGLLSLFLGLGKRRAELMLLESGAASHRRILQEYSIPMLDQMISVVTGATIIGYTLFTFTATTLPLKPYPIMTITVPFVIYGILRYLYLIHQRSGGDSPEELVLKDLPLALSIFLYGMTVLALLWIYRH